MGEYATNKKKKRFRPASIIIGLILIIIILAGFAKSYYDKLFLAVDPDNSLGVTVEIPQGSGAVKIAEILFNEDLIKNQYIFRIAVKNKEVANKLKAGKYELNKTMDVNEIIDKLTAGSKNENVTSFTIPEGYEIKQIADSLAEKGLVNKERFLQLTSDKNLFEDKHEFLEELEDGQSLEGFLFPSTYEIYLGASEEEIIDRMLSQFGKVYEEELKGKMDKYDFDLNELVTLASIIEREAKLDEERTMISAVFHNRLEEGMLLQSCATVQYILGERKEVLSTRDTQIPSDFNTYINIGLPPHPIAVPGAKSLIASLEPEDVDYLYFRTREDGSGGHTFSRTYDEHIKADPNK